VRSDCPAALPLIGFIAGLLLPAGDAFGFALIAILLLLIRKPRLTIVFIAIALGTMRTAEGGRRTVIPEDKFTTISADIDRDWIDRRSYHALRVRVNGEPLTIVARFPPRPIEMEATVTGEGFVRLNEREELTLIVKSPRLLHYDGRLNPWAPATWNRALANRLRPFASEFPTEVALVEALALGRGERLAEDVRDGYKRAGTYHLLVFSGLQIAFAAAGLAAMLRWLRAPRVSDWSLLAFAIAAPLFIGPNASVSRASIGIGVYAISRLLHRPTTLENLWCLAALVRLIIAPADVADAAFQLTYGGAGALLFVAKPLAASRMRWLVLVATVECVVTPITLFHFHQYSLGGSLTTLALTPLVSALLIVSAATCAYPCAALLRCIGFIHAIAMKMNAIGAHAAGAFAAPDAVAFGCALLGVLMVIAILRGRRRALAIVMCMLIPTASAIAISRHDVALPTVTVLDIGQGDAILIRTPGHAMLVDAGPSGPRILPLLADLGIRHLDAVLLTHAHPDHCGGIPAVLSRIGADSLWISPRRFTGDCAAELLDSASDTPIHLVRDGDFLNLGGISVRALTQERTYRRSPENNSSVVLRLGIGRRVALLTGDIEREAEAEIASRAGCVDVLKVAHHGSRTSSTPLLLDAIAPRIAIISCGRHNLFGHPHAEVLAALRERGIATYRTDRDHSVDLECDGAHILVHRRN
jgi:competence protein ComEC